MMELKPVFTLVFLCTSMWPTGNFEALMLTVWFVRWAWGSMPLTNENHTSLDPHFLLLSISHKWQIFTFRTRSDAYDPPAFTVRPLTRALGCRHRLNRSRDTDGLGKRRPIDIFKTLRSLLQLSRFRFLTSETETSPVILTQ